MPPKKTPTKAAKKPIKKATAVKKKPIGKTKPRSDRTTDSSGLTLKQKLFSKYYLFGSGTLPEGQEEFRLGNALRSYALAYVKKTDTDARYHMCGVEGSKNLKKPKIKDYMKELLEETGFNNNIVDARLVDLIKNGGEKGAMSAIKEYNKLAGRITEKVEHTGSLDLNTEDVDGKDLGEVKSMIQELIHGTK